MSSAAELARPVPQGMIASAMDFIVIPLVSAAVAALTLVSGFGLGTLLMPAFAGVLSD